MLIIKRLIIGTILVTGLVIQAGSVNAIYSSTISARVSIIKQNVQNARALNGTGTITSAIESIKAQDDKRIKEGQATSLPAEAATVIPKVIAYMFYDLMNAPLDSIYMVFNILPSSGTVISTCLRNDIWYLEDLRDIVSQEMIKAYLMMDSNNGDILYNDYQYLRKQINVLKEYGPRPDDILLVTYSDDTAEYMSSSEYLFGEKSSVNKYSITYPVGDGCPESEFMEAFDEVQNSLINLKTLSSGSGSDWGSIKTMAEARARRRAEEWIKANQITLTLGGENGGNTQSLIKGDSWNLFVGQMKTQLKILKDMIGPITPLFSWDIYSRGDEAGDEVSYGCMYYYTDAGVFRACTVEQLENYKACEEGTQDEDVDCNRFRKAYTVSDPVQVARAYENQVESHEKEVEDAERAFKYNMNLTNISEQSLIEMDRVMWEINKEIGRAYEADGEEAGKSLPYLYSQLATFLKNHCGGKNCP